MYVLAIVENGSMVVLLSESEDLDGSLDCVSPAALRLL
jgi:hypothetical protein